MEGFDICVVGGCSMDMTYIEQEDGTYFNSPSLNMPGGKASNQAVAASRAGAKVAIISKIGKDEVGKSILNNLLDNNVDVSGVEVVDGLKNDCCKIYIDHKTKDNTIVREAGAINSFTTSMIQNHKDILLNSKIVVAQMKAPKEFCAALINFCHKNNIPLIITPCRPEKLSISDPQNRDLIKKISFITANRKECEAIFGTDDIEKCVSRLPNKLIVTLGEKGVVWHDGKSVRKLPAVKVSSIVDTTGAGDTFNGNLAALLAAGCSLEAAIKRAQYASAMKLAKEGAQAGMPFKNELTQFINNFGSQQN